MSQKMTELKAALAARGGLDVDTLTLSAAKQFDLLLSQGLAVRISVHGSSMFEVPLTDRVIGVAVETDTERRFRKNHVRLGSFCVVESKISGQLHSKETSAHNYVRGLLRTIGFEIETGWIWIPFLPDDAAGNPQGFRQVKARLEEYRSAYLAEIEYIAEFRDSLLHRSLRNMEKVAETLYCRINRVHRKRVSVPAQFVKELQEFVIKNFPKASGIRARAGFDIMVKAYPMPSQIAADKLRTAEISHTAENLSAQTRAIYEAEQARQKLLLAEQAKYLEEERRRKERDLDPLIAGIAERLQQVVSRVVANVSNAVNRSQNGRLPNPTLAQVRGLARDLEPLMFMVGDTRLRDLAAKLESLARGAGASAPDTMIATLAKLEKAAVQRAADLRVDVLDFVEL